jgi:hypothetical protein
MASRYHQRQSCVSVAVFVGVAVCGRVAPLPVDGSSKQRDLILLALRHLENLL